MSLSMLVVFTTHAGCSDYAADYTRGVLAFLTSGLATAAGFTGFSVAGVFADLVALVVFGVTTGEDESGSAFTLTLGVYSITVSHTLSISKQDPAFFNTGKMDCSR